MPYIINRKLGAVDHKGGFELDLALQNGWELYDPVQKVAKPEESVTIQPQPARRAGRPRKYEIPSILNDGAEDDDSAKPD